MKHLARRGLALLALAGPASAQQAGTAAGEPAQLEPVVVIGTSPLPGQGVERDKLPYGTQVIQRDRIDEQKPLNLVDYLNRSVPGVQVNEITGNPYQGDLTFRGYRASPLLGAGQGISVFLDGVRINEPFGDVDDLSLTHYWDWTGFPVVSLPSGVGKRSGLPTSVSLIGAPGADWDVLAWGIALQAELGTVSP